MAFYDFDLKDDDGARVYQICDLEVEYRIEGSGEFVFTGIFMTREKKRPVSDPLYVAEPWADLGRVNLLNTPDRLLTLLGASVLADLEKDGEWQAERLEEDGWSYRGLGGNDPDGGWRRVA